MLKEDEQIMLVNSQDKVLGSIGKKAAHQGIGKLHRAITVFLFNEKGEILLTQRSAKKPLWPLWWDAACSTHQWVDEDDGSCAQRRIPFELGTGAVQNLKFIFSYEYHAVYSNEWSENEVNHILTGTLFTDPQPNPDEVADWRWASQHEVLSQLRQPNHHFAPWFPLAMERLACV